MIKRPILTLATIATAVALTATACTGTEADPNLEGAGGKAKKGLHTVVYYVGGTAKSGDLTYTTPSGQQQDGKSKLPWTKTFRAKGGEILALSGQNSASGAITCKITLDGKVIKQSKSTGQFAVVSCDAMIGF